MRWVEVTGSSAFQRSRVAANLAILASYGKLPTRLECGDVALEGEAARLGVPQADPPPLGQSLGFRTTGGPVTGSTALRIHLLDVPVDELFHVEQAGDPPGVLAVVCHEVDALERVVRRRKEQGLEAVLPYRVPVLSQESPLPVTDADMSRSSQALMELFQEVMNHVGQG